MNYPNISQNSAASEADEESTSVIQRGRQLRCVGVATAEAVAFWAAVALPLPTFLVLSLGVGTPTELLAVSALLTSNLVAFYVGHGYAQQTN